MLGSRGFASTTMIELIPVLVLAQLWPVAQVNCSFCPVAELSGGNNAERRDSPLSGACSDISPDPGCPGSADGVDSAPVRPASGKSGSPGRKYANCPCKWGSPASTERVSKNGAAGRLPTRRLIRYCLPAPARRSAHRGKQPIEQRSSPVRRHEVAFCFAGFDSRFSSGNAIPGA